MRLISLLLAIVLLSIMTLPAKAGHSRGNGTCTDDAIHWQNMIDKRSDAPLWQYSKDTQVKAVEQRLKGNWAECETLVEEAIRAIRKPYPTE